MATREQNELVFIAAFGDSAADLIGQRLSAKHGIVGQVYQNGTPYLSADVESDKHFYREIDAQTGHKSHSIVAVPVYIGKHVCGVLELINRLDGKTFTKRDMTLLEIFAGYTSFTLQNALDAKRAQELAKKDDLTGLYNDRWFNVRLSETLSEASSRKITVCASVWRCRPKPASALPARSSTASRNTAAPHGHRPWTSRW